MADKQHGILIDIGFKTDVESYVKDIENQLKGIDFGDKIGLSKAFEDEFDNAKDKLKKLKSEIDRITGGVLDDAAKQQLADTTKAVKELQNAFKLLLQATPKNKRDGILNKMQEIDTTVNNTVDVINNAVKAISHLGNNITLVDKEQLKTLKDYYVQLENARKYTEEFDKTINQRGTKPYQSSEDALTDLIAKYDLYKQKLNEIDIITRSRKSKADKESMISGLQLEISRLGTDASRLINTIMKLDANWGQTKIGKSGLAELQQEISDRLEGILKEIARRKAEIQNEYSKLGGGDLSKIFVQSKNKDDKITIPVHIDGYARATVKEEALQLISDVNRELESTPLRIEVQLVSAYQSRGNQKLLNELQAELIKMQQTAKEAIEGGMSEAESLKYTEMTENMSKLIDRINKQVNNAMLFTVDIQTETAASMIRSFVADVKEELRKIQDSPIDVEPKVTLTKKNQDAFKKKVNAFIKECNKEVNSIEVLKDKLAKNLFENYINQLKDSISQLKSLQKEIGKESVSKNLSEAFKTLADDYAKMFNPESIKPWADALLGTLNQAIQNMNQLTSLETKEGEANLNTEELQKQIGEKIEAVRQELSKAFDPKNNNLSVWATKLLNTLDQASSKISQLFSPNGQNMLSEYLQDIALTDTNKKKYDGVLSTLEHGGILLESGKVIGLTSTDEHDATKYGNPIYYPNASRQNIVADIHTHSGDFVWSPSIEDLEIGLTRGLKYAITSAVSEVATFNSEAYLKDEIDKKIDFRQLKKYTNKPISNKITSDKIKELFYNNIDLISNNKMIGFLKGSSPINEAKNLSNKEFMTEVFKQAYNSKPTSEQDFWQQIITNIGDQYFSGRPDQIYAELDNLLGNVFHFTSPGLSRTAALAVRQDRLKQYFANKDVDFNKYFKIQSQEDFAKNPAFDLGKYLNNNDQINIADVTKNINQIVDNVNKLNELDAEKKQANEQLLADINTNLQSIVQELPNLSKAMNELSVKGIAMVPKVINETSVAPNENTTSSSTQPTQIVSKETSKVAEQLGKYFGENYAQGILNEKKKVQNAIRALVETGKLTEQDLAKDKSSESDYVYNKRVNGIQPTTQAKHYQKMIEEFDTYQRVIQQSLKLKLPTDETLKNNVLTTHKKNLEELQSGAINANDAMKRLHDTYGDFAKGDSNIPLLDALKEIPKAEEKPVVQTQELINKFEELKTLIQNAFTSKDLSSVQKYFDEINKINEQLDNEHVAGKRKRNSYIKTTQTSLEQLKSEIKKEEKKQSSTNEAKTIKDVTKAVKDKTKAFENETKVVVPGLVEETKKVQELGNALKEIPKLINDKTSAFKNEKTEVKNAITSEISDLGKLSKAQYEEKKKQEQEANLQKAQKNLNKNFNNIQTGFADMLQKDNRKLIESSFEPTKDGLIKIKALIKEADDNYKSLIYTTKTGNGKNPFTLVEAKEGFSIDKQAAAYEKWIQIQEQLKNPKMIGKSGEIITPNTDVWYQLIDLAKDFGLEISNIDRIIRHVDQMGFESFQFWDNQNHRTTLGINSQSILYESQAVVEVSKTIDEFEKKVAEIPKILSDSMTKYDANAGQKYINDLNQIAKLWETIQSYVQAGVVSPDKRDVLQQMYDSIPQTFMDFMSAKLPEGRKTDEEINRIRSLFAEIKQLFDSLSLDNLSVIDDSLSARIKDALVNAKELYQTINSGENKVAKETSVSKLLARIGDELTRNSKMSQVYKDQLNAIVKEMLALGKAIPEDKMKEFTARFQDIDSKIRLSGQTGKGILGQVSTTLVRSISQFANMYLSLYRLVSYIRQGVTEVSNLNKALTTMSYTMDVTDAQLNNMSRDIVNMAKDLSISVSNVSQIYQIYANMQTSAEEIMETAKPTAILANLSGVDASTAADQIQGVLNQFELLADESMHIVDVYDYISANISVDYSKGIAGMSDAVKNVGNVAKEAGLSFEQLSAIIGKVMEKTRQDGASIGNALRTMMVRISKANKLAGDEVDNATVGNAAKALHKIGIEVYTTEGEFREFDTIMSELAEKWDDLSDAERENISFQIAATRQTATLRAVLDQWADSSKLATEAIEAEGNALANQEKYEESIAGKTQQLKNELSQFWIDTISSDKIETILDELKDLITEINNTNSTASIFANTVSSLLESVLKVVNVINKIPGGLFGVLFGLTKGKNMVSTNLNPTGGINIGLGKHVVGTAFKGLQTRAYTDNDIALFNQYVSQGAQNNDIINQMSKNAQNLVKSYGNVIDKQDDIINKMKTETVTSKALTAARLALNVALSVGISLLTSVVIKGINEWIHAEENARKELAESLRAAEERRKEFEKQQATLEDIITKYKDYQEQLKNTNKTEEDVANIRSGLADLQKTLNEQYGETAKQLDLVNGQYERELKLMKLLGEQDTAEYLRNNKATYKENSLTVAAKKGYEFGFSYDFFPAITGGSSADEDIIEMLKRGGFDPFSEYTAEEFYNSIQDVLIYYQDKTNDAYYKTFEQFEKDWRDYLADDESVYASMKAAEDWLKAYNEVFTLSGSYAEEYQTVENQLEELRKALNEEDFTKLSNLYQRYYQSVNRSGMKAEENSAFSDLYREMTSIYQQGQRDQAKYSEDAIKAILSYYPAPHDSAGVAEVLKKKFTVDTKKEFDILEASITEVKQKGIQNYDELFDVYQRRLHEAVEETKEAEKISYSDWLDEKSNFKSSKDSKDNLSNNALINAWESTVKGFGEYLEQDEQGQIKIDFGKIIQFTRDDNLVQQLGLDTFESYMKKYGESTTAIFAYVFDAEKKLKANIDKDFKDQDIFYQTLENIKTEALGGSISVDKLEDSYQELTGILKQVEDEIKFDKEKMTALINKYPELKSAVKKYSDDSYSLQKENLENLIDTYIEFENTAISTQLQLKRYTLETIIATANLGVTVEQLASSYASILNEDGSKKVDVSGHDYEYIFGDLSGTGKSYQEVEKAVQDYNEIREKALRQLRETIGSSDKNDKDNSDKNKSEFDWLDSYLDKRNRQLQKEETLYENLGKQTVEDIEKQLDAYSKGGNVNLKLRPEIDAEELNKQGYNAGEGYATIFSQTFSNEAETVAVNFTPIIVDPKTGEYLGVMEKGEFEKYCQDVIDGVRTDDLNLQIGTEFTGKDAIDQAETAARKIHYLHEQLHADSDIELLYNYRQNQSLEEQNHLLDEQIKAYSRAEKQYGKRMQKGLLVDDMMKAFGNDKGKVDELIQKIIDRESINLEELTSDQASAVTAMAENFNKKLEAADKVLEAQNKKRENNLKMFTNNIEYITQKYDHVLNEFAQRQSELEHYQTMRTNAGMMENQKLYVALLDNESRELDQNIQKRNDLIEELKDFEVQTEDDLVKWYETKDAIDSTTQAIWENQEAIESYKMSMQQLSWDLDDKIMEIVGNVRNESDFLIDVLGTFEKDMYSYTREYLGNDAEKTKIYSGELSDQGLATLALRRVNAKTYREQIESLNEQIKNAQNLYLQDTTDTTYLERVEKLTKDRQDLIKSYNDEREAIIELVKDGYDKQLQSLQAISDKYLEAAQNSKELYDYQKNLAKQTKNIANIRKQISAYAGDLSEEARGKLQTLTVQLEEAEEGLADTQYERTLQQQQQIFDHLYQNLEDYFNDKLEEPTRLLKSTEAIVNANMGTIKETLSGMLSFYGTDISPTLDNILGDDGIGAIEENIDAVDGDIKNIKDSVTGQTKALAEYLKNHEIDLKTEEELNERMKTLYGTTEGSFDWYLKSLKDLLAGISNKLTMIDITNSAANSMLSSINQATALSSIASSAVSGITSLVKAATPTSLLNGSSFFKKKAKGGHINNDMLAWTQEYGLEAILRPTDNAILTPLKAGDSVLTAEATKNLWDFANNPLDFMKQNVGMTTVSKNAGVTFNNSIAPTIVVNGVSNATEFIRELQKNKQFESMIQDMTINQMNGGNPLAKMKYKF